MNEDQPETRQFVPPGHYDSPIPDLADVRHRSTTGGLFDRERRTLPGVDLGEDAQVELAASFARYDVESPFPVESDGTTRYHLDNPFFPFSDGIVLYSMLREFRPRRIVEIGSGFSSAVILDTIERFFVVPPTCTFVDPDLERLRSLLKPDDRGRHRLVEGVVQDLPLATFDDLEEHDVLFIDSSHVAKVGSDVNHLVFEVLPRLRPGVLVHFHDVPHPFEYHEHWILEGRAWNEAYLLRAFLQFNAVFEVVCFPSFLMTFHRLWFEENMPLCLRNPGGSLWIRRTSTREEA